MGFLQPWLKCLPGQGDVQKPFGPCDSKVKVTLEGQLLDNQILHVDTFDVL